MLLALQVCPSHAQWVPTSGPKGGGIRSFLVVPGGGGGSTLFAGQLGVWRTPDQGASWTNSSDGFVDPNVFALIAVPNGQGGVDIVAGTNGGVFRSTNNGANWTALNNGLTSLNVYALAAGPNGSGGTNLYAGTYLNGLFRSTNNGASWAPASSGIAVNHNINAILTSPSGTVIAATSDGIYRSTNFAASWSRHFQLHGLSLTRNGSTIYAGTSNGVYRSTDDGVSWVAINNGMNFNWVRAVAAIPNGAGVTLFAGAGGVLRSTDNGATWTSVNTGLTSLVINVLVTAPNPAGGTDLFAGTGEGIFRTTDNGNSWTNASFIYSQVHGLGVSPTGTILAATENDVFRSADGGANWTDTGVNTWTLDFAVNPHGIQGVSLFSGGSPSGIFKSTDDGATWVYASNLLDDFDVNSLGAVPNGAGGTNLLAGTYSELFISTNDGGGWRKGNLQTLTLDYVATPNGAGGHDYYAGGVGGVWRSTNYGTAWTPVSAALNDKVVEALATTANGDNLFAGGGPFGVLRSTDDGATWTAVNNGLTNLTILALLSPDGTNLFAGGGGGVFLSTDHGASWTSVNSGLSTGVYSLALSADGQTLMAGTTGSGVWKRPLSELLEVVPPPPPTPPAIASFTPASGSAGTVVTISGSNLTGASTVQFNSTNATSFTVVSATQILATVPAGATTGKVSVTTPVGNAASSTDFVVSVLSIPTTLTFAPPHDAWVRSTTPSANFGSRSELSIRGGSTTIRSFLKFNVSGVSAPVQRATLRLRVTDAGSNGGSLFSISNNLAGSATPWTESVLRWNNAPAISGSALAVAGAVSVGAWIEWDVTSAVTGNGTFSFALTSSSSNAVEYSSSEGANPPQLVVVFEGSAQTPSADASANGTGATRGELILRANHPNPFDATTTIGYSLPQAMPVRLVVYDVTGRAVRSLVDGEQPAGEQRATWDGRNDRGVRVLPGLYVYRLEANGAVLSRKLNLVK
jgi:hypothetical protein